MRKHVHRLLCAQRDVLSTSAIVAVQEPVDGLQMALRSGVSRSEILEKMAEVEAAANKWLKPYPNPGWRENVEVLLVALAVAMGIRTFFLQPFKIPTGSMQPTLYGITSENLLQHPDFRVPTGLTRLRNWFAGISYIDLKAKADGSLERIDNPVGIKIFNFWQTLQIGGVKHFIWFPPDYGQADLRTRAGLQLGQHYRKGDPVAGLRVKSGDHLFVNRTTYNFRRPKRGEIIVFETLGILALPQDQFYIKRLVALGGERVQIGNDRHLIIDGQRLDASTAHFENVYTFDSRQPPEDSRYSGHLNEAVARQYHRHNLAPLFPDESTTYLVPSGHYMVMGDNTVNSYDSRGWGDFPATNVIGKSFFVYWPISSRFGWGQK